MVGARRGAARRAGATSGRAARLARAGRPRGCDAGTRGPRHASSTCCATAACARGGSSRPPGSSSARCPRSPTPCASAAADPFMLDPTHLQRFELVDALRERSPRIRTPPPCSSGSAIRSSRCWPRWCCRSRATAAIRSSWHDDSSTVCGSVPSPRRSSSTSSRRRADARRGATVSTVSTRSRCSRSPAISRRPSGRVRSTSWRSRWATSRSTSANGSTTCSLASSARSTSPTSPGGEPAPSWSGDAGGAPARRRGAVAAGRVRRAPRAYLLAHAPDVIARHAALLDPPPRRGTSRGRRPSPTTRHASRSPRTTARAPRRGVRRARGAADRRGRRRRGDLARRRGGRVVPRAFALPAADAVAAIGDLERPSPGGQRPPAAEPAPDLEIEFDNDASPWYTLCEVRGDDRPGCSTPSPSGS